jgi:multiple sugar transport system substrate-binding protein
MPLGGQWRERFNSYPAGVASVTNIVLRGITWNHSRAFPPLVAASQRYEELNPHVRVEWTKRSLDDFGHAGLSDFARSCDLLVIDHPMLGTVHRDRTLLDLQPKLRPANLTELEADALGPCLDSYRYEGCLYALPIDAAAPAASYRADLLAQHGLQAPENWNDLIALARRGLVSMPGFPADLFLNFLGMCTSRHGTVLSNDQFLDPAVAVLCMEELLELASLMTPAIYTMNPIALYEAMTLSDEFAYCPFAYTYSNYSRPGFAQRAILFANAVPLSDGAALRTVLGGTGMAISSASKHQDVAIDFSLFVAGASCQTHVYGVCGGQPASKAAWQSQLLNDISNDFFKYTMSSIESAYVRPRYAGYIQLQASAGHAITAFLHRELTATQALDRIEELYRSSLTTAQGLQENSR